jgi:hypothetical protein
MTQLPITCQLPTLPKAIGEVATTIWDSMTMFTNIRGDVVAYICAHVCSRWKVDLDFEIKVHGLYGVARFLSFLR